MKAALLSLVATATLALASPHDAHNHAHNGFHVEKDVMPVSPNPLIQNTPPPALETSVVEECCTMMVLVVEFDESHCGTPNPLTAQALPPTSTSTPPPPPPSSSKAPPPPPPPPSSPAPPPPAKPLTLATPAVFAAAPPSSSPLKISSVGKPGYWAMTYSPYLAGGGCKDTGSITADISKIASLGFRTVRIYSTDCGGLQAVGNAAAAHGLKMILGIYIDSAGIDSSKGQITAIQNWGRYDLVEMIVVGNECIFNGWCSASDLASYIQYVKSVLGSGFSGPYTTSEPLNILQANAGALCGVVDVVGSNIHPFFNSAISAASAGTFAASQLQLVAACCPGKNAYNLVTGWPHTGQANGAAVPGQIQQKTAIQAIMASIGGKSAMFSFIDDKWKEPGAFGVEPNFGCSQLF